MIKEMYDLPNIEWITFIPSLRHPDLVKSLAERVGFSLNSKVYAAIEAKKLRPPQKTMENSNHQVSNLDGQFQVNLRGKSGNVLLLDDMVDSGWTLTAAALLLRKARAGLVSLCLAKVFEQRLMIDLSSSARVALLLTCQLRTTTSSIETKTLSAQAIL
jgi:phosphoribosylpyrophosphate synthetase